MSMMGSTAAMSESGLWLPGATASTTKEDKIEKWWEVNRKHDPPLTRGATPLVERCMRVLGWKQGFAERVLKGYRQFMELKSVMNDWQATKLTAPLAIQQMWEQHLLDNLNYTDDCFLLFGRVIGHDPDAGLNERLTIDRVKTTKIAFQARYGADLDPDVWEFGAADFDSSGGGANGQGGGGNGMIDAEEHQMYGGAGGGVPGQVDGNIRGSIRESTPRGRLPVAGFVAAAAAGMMHNHSTPQQQQQPQHHHQAHHHASPHQVPPQHQQHSSMHDQHIPQQVRSVPSNDRDVSMSPRGRSLVASSDDENTPIVSRPSSPPRQQRNSYGGGGGNVMNNNQHGTPNSNNSGGNNNPNSAGGPKSSSNNNAGIQRSPKSPSGNDPITIFLRDVNSGEETYFSLRYRSTLRIVFTVFAERKGLSQDNLKFSFNGQGLTGYETPYSLGLEDRARIDVQIGQR